MGGGTQSGEEAMVVHGRASDRNCQENQAQVEQGGEVEIEAQCGDSVNLLVDPL